MKAKELIKELKKLGNKEVAITVDNKSITAIKKIIVGRDDYENDVIVLDGGETPIVTA
jgi:hypothetical protein